MPSLATASQGGNAGGFLFLLLPIALIALMFWSQRRRTKATAQAQAQLQVGDEVSTTSGLLGTLRSLDDEVGTLEIASGVVVHFDRRAIVPRTVIQRGTTAADGVETDGDDTPPTTVS